MENGKGKPTITPVIKNNHSDIHLLSTLSNISEFEENLTKRLLRPGSLRSFKTRVTDILISLGVSDWVYTRLDMPLPDAFESHLGTKSVEYRKIYINEAMYEYDLVLQHAKESTVPIYRSAVEKMFRHSEIKGELIRRNLGWLNTLKKLGFMDSLHIPIHSPNGQEKVLFSLSTYQMKSEDFRIVTEQNVSKLVALGRIIHEIGSLNYSESFIDRKLKFESKKFLKSLDLLYYMVTCDMTLKEVALKKSMSISAAEKHLAYLKNELKTKSTANAFFVADKKGLFTKMRER